MSNQVSSYEQQAIDFAAKYGLSMSAKWVKFGRHFINDEFNRNVWSVTLVRTLESVGEVPLGRNYTTKHKSKVKLSFTFNFGMGAVLQENKHKAPSLYDVLACLQKYDVGTLEDFCREFGYFKHERTSKRLYKAVCKEYASLCRLFPEDQDTEVWESLQNIC